MGCCQSTTIPTRPTKSTNTDVTSPNRHSLPESEDRAPPPPAVLEEETVKEVLSETPISKPPTPTIPTNINPTQEPDVLQQVVKKIEPLNLSKPTEEEIIIVSEISEASEMCSFSGSFSTTTLNEKDEGEVSQRVVPRPQAKTPRKPSYSGELHGPRDRGLRSPARRSAPSPVKRNQMRSRPAQGITTTTVQRRNVGPTNGSRWDPGEASVQRSRSPAQRGEMVPGRNGGYKTPASSMTENLGGRSPVRKIEEGEKLEKRDDGVSAAEGNESLENPHVSLECFIFL